MLGTIWKFRVLVVIAALVLVVGGAVAFAASEGPLSSSAPSGSKAGVSHSSEGGQQGSEPTATSAPAEPTATKGTEPTAIPHANMAGKITSVDCAGGSITIAVDNNGGSFTAQITSATHITVSGQAASCSGLKVGWHVTIEAQQLNGQWVAENIAQDDSGQGGGAGGGDGGATPTPTPSH